MVPPKLSEAADGKQWIPLRRGAREDTPAQKSVARSGIQAINNAGERAMTGRPSTQFTYQAGGVYKGTITADGIQYDTLSAPLSGQLLIEGMPQIPQEGVFVAIPEGATNVTARVVRKATTKLPGEWRLAPAPAPVTEQEYLEGKQTQRPDAAVYGSDVTFPGKDIELIGVRRLEGVPVAHVLIYLAQYNPKSGRMIALKSITVEVGYEAPMTRDAVPQTRSYRPLLADMIIDFESVSPPPASDRDLDAMPQMDPPVGPLQPLGPIGPVQPVGPVGPIGPIGPALFLGHEYLIIVPDALKAAVKPLADATAGFPLYSGTYTTSWIQTKYPAANLKESIVLFLQASRSWRIAPRYVVLAGDVDTIPVNYYASGGINYASDHYYADLGGDLSPEIVVSRIPTSDPVKMAQVAQCLTEYKNERGPDWVGWANEVLLVAYQDATYKNCSDQIAAKIGPRYKVTKLYGDASNKAQVLQKMNAGVLAVNYRRPRLKDRLVFGQRDQHERHSCAGQRQHAAAGVQHLLRERLGGRPGDGDGRRGVRA